MYLCHINKINILNIKFTRKKSIFFAKNTPVYN